MPRLFRFFGNSASNAAGFAIGAAVHPTLRPITQTVVNETWELHPNVPLTPEQAAAAVERGEMSYADAEKEARKSGTNEQRFKIIERLAGLAPAPEQLVTMRRRGIIDAARLKRGLVQGNVRSEWSDALAALAEVLLTPGELARLVAEGYATAAEGRAAAAEIGVHADNFDRLVQLAGSGPSVERALTLWNRGEIDEADVDRAFRQQGIRAEWREPLKSLAKHLPSPSDGIRFAVKDVFDPAVVARFKLDAEFPDAFLPLAKQLGIDPEQAEWYWAAHWRNVSPTQLYQMLWRGEITPGDLDAGLKVADYSPFWRDKLKNIAYKVPGRIDLRRMYAEGLIDRAGLVDGYGKLGYDAANAERLADFAVKLATGAGKEATAADELALYDGDRINRAELQRRLVALGYAADDANRKADVLDARRVSAARTTAIGAVRASYLKHEVTDAEAAAALSRAGVAEWAQPLMLEQWDVARDVTRAELSVAEIQRAHRRGLLTLDAAAAELTQRGYSPDEARTLLGLTVPTLTVRQVTDAFKAGIRTREEAAALLAGMGFAAADVALLLGAIDPNGEAARIAAEVKAGTLARAAAVAQLVALGYSAPAAEAFLGEPA